MHILTELRPTLATKITRLAASAAAVVAASAASATFAYCVGIAPASAMFGKSGEICSAGKFTLCCRTVFHFQFVSHVCFGPRGNVRLCVSLCVSMCVCVCVWVKLWFVPAPKNLNPKPKPAERKAKLNPFVAALFTFFICLCCTFWVAPKFARPACVCVRVCVAVCVCDINVSLANDAHVCDAAFCLHFYFNPHRCLLFSRQMLKPKGGEELAGQGAGYL